MTSRPAIAPEAAASRARPAAALLLPGAAVAVLVLLFFHKLAFSNLILARGDTFLYFYPYWQAAAEALRAGRVPLWNPAIFMGAPFLANSQAGFFYPLNWPLWLLLPTPYAASAAIVLHVMLAGWGTYLAGRRLLRLASPAALLAGALFALGGYLTAQVEHINQAQGLAWLPWYFVALAPLVGEPSRLAIIRAGLTVAALFALQLLAGHTQTAFISGMSAGVWALGYLARGKGGWRKSARVLGALAGGALLAAALAGAQLLPTLELTRYSSRQGGLALNDVLSFSWNPLHAARAVLPAYGQSLFSEYVMTLPIAGLLFGMVGAWRWRRERAVAALVLLAIASLVLALGRFTPVYWALAYVPGFNLFRVPARWLAPAALAVALLAGYGWQLLTAPGAERRDAVRPLAAGIGLVVLLVAWAYAGRWLAGLIPAGAEAPYESPSPLTLAGWAAELAVLALLMAALWRGMAWARWGLLLLPVAVLWLASRSLPYNNPTTPEAYFDLRPPIARLQALGRCLAPEAPCVEPPGRLLSLSDIFFDPGDQAEIDAIYAGQLDEAARYDYTVAIKHKEVVSPNLPMAYGLTSVDGFDGGILPLRDYSRLMTLILPPGEETADGRLREYLDAVPEGRWLDLFGARYVITDKTGDAWVEGVVYDRQFPLALEAGQEAAVTTIPFEATELRLLSSAPPLVELRAGDEMWQLAVETEEDGGAVARFPRPASPEAITLRCPAEGDACAAEALTLVDARDGAFQPLTPAPYRLIQSGDVKVYENAGALPRAFLVHDWTWATDGAAAVEMMAEPGFDPRLAAVVIGEPAGEAPPGGGAGTAEIATYEPERVVVRASTMASALLALADANYPGWRATVDGLETDIYTADGVFRGVLLPAGEHEVEFTFRPASARIGALLSLAGLLVWAGVLFLSRRPGRGG